MGASVARGGRSGRLAAWRDNLRNGARRSAMLLGGALLVVGATLLLFALASYRPSDPSLNTAAAGPVENWVGPWGAWASDLLLSLFGPPGALLLPFLLLVGMRIARGAPLGRWAGLLLLSLLGILLVGTAAALVVGGAIAGLPAGWGGVFGFTLAQLIDLGLAQIGEPGIAAPFRVAAIVLARLPATSVTRLPET